VLRRIAPVGFVSIEVLFWTVLAGGFVFTLLAETIWPKAKISIRDRATHFFHNFMLWVVVIGVVTATVEPVMHAVNQLGQFHRIGLLPLLDAPLWLAAVAGFLVADFSDYVLHRASHQNRTLWLLHAIHHSDRQLDVTTSLRQHPLSFIFVFAVRAALVLALGAPLLALVLRDICGVAMSHIHHASIAWSPRAIDWMERYLSWLIVPPTAHWFHHDPDPRHTNSNYGQVLSWWDRLFGTYQPGLNPPQLSGLSALHESHWHTVWGMLVTPWRARNIAQL
jgi:sterol desaturase/sphingolipid hydroxylase (fatty acid hydroxylase superfamily)